MMSKHWWAVKWLGGEMKGVVFEYKGSSEYWIKSLNSVTTNLNMGNSRTGVFFLSSWNTAAVTAIHHLTETNSNLFRKQKKYYGEEVTFHKIVHIL